MKGERACARIFKLFRTPGINSTELVDWFRVFSFVGYSSLHMKAEMIPGKFLHSLKVHKIEIFFGFDFEICIISLLVMSKYSDFTKKFF